MVEIPDPPVTPYCEHNHDCLDIQDGDIALCIKCGTKIVFNGTSSTFDEVLP